MARLSFSIAITETPEILIIDEVLAVGDQGFQRKCMNRINEIHKKGGTILFVSHSLADVQRICTRGICINNNVIEKEGNMHEVGKYYNSLFEN
jgi:ABC-type polysaccharide/polyol phosphate transport system ATPase subunit